LVICYEWEIGYPKCEKWAIRSRVELYKTRLGYVCLDRKARDLKDISRIIKNEIKDIPRQSSKEKNERKSFDLIKQEWEKELCIDQCNMIEFG